MPLDSYAYWQKIVDEAPWELIPRPDSFVYVVKADDDPPIKVGVATDMRARLSQLQTGNPRKLHVLHLLLGDTKLERHFHKELRRGQMTGEWFRGELVKPFVERARNLAGQMIEVHKETGAFARAEDFIEVWTPRKTRSRREEAPLKVTTPEGGTRTVENPQRRGSWA